MAGGGVPEPRVCKLCQGDGVWRCRDCLGKPLLCGQCCQDQHRLQPFHRVQRWNGTFFEDSWLYRAGVALNFGHGGHPCPSRSAFQEVGYSTGRGYRTGSSFAHDPGTGPGAQELGTGTPHPVTGSGTANQVTGAGTQNRVTTTGNRTRDLAAGWPESNEQQPLPTPAPTDEEDEADQSNNVRFDEIPEGMPLPIPPPPEAEPFCDGSPDPAWSSKKDANGTPLVVVVDRSGMHLFPVFWCECHGAVAHEFQALDMALYPASHKAIRTLFTFQCLDDFLADNQECNTTAYHYIEKLRRLTSSSFPHTAPVGSYFLTSCSFPNYVRQNRYQELMRLEREWRYIKNMEWHGFVHEDRQPGPGELTHGCPSCPQPGVNLPDAWQADPRK